LKGTTDHEVLFKTNGHLNIQIFTDADWAGDKGNRISTSGYLSLVGGNLVTWKSKNQKVISLSSVEAELRGITKGLAEALWIRKLVSKIRYPDKSSGNGQTPQMSKQVEFWLVPPCFAIFTFELLTLSLTSMPSCDLESLTNILIMCLILKALNQNLRKSLSLNLELS
ncbi:putative ribonuclease H-like domain-containing protein, partial [Tanacetum coccineum]